MQFPGATTSRSRLMNVTTHRIGSISSWLYTCESDPAAKQSMPQSCFWPFPIPSLSLVAVPHVASLSAAQNFRHHAQQDGTFSSTFIDLEHVPTIHVALDICDRHSWRDLARKGVGRRRTGHGATYPARVMAASKMNIRCNPSLVTSWKDANNHRAEPA
jgi:hypothetical protein